MRRAASSANDHEFVRIAVVEKRSPSGDPRSTRALIPSPARSQKPRREDGVFYWSRLRLFKPSRRWTMTDQPTPTLQSGLQGLWLPLVTPFRNGELDESSLRRLVRHYASGPIDGLILAATSGEGLLLDIGELEHLVAAVRSELAAMPRILPICLGLAGASTQRLKEKLDET